MPSSFDARVIPPDSRSNKHVAEHREMWKRANDIWRVYNPTDQDYTVWFDHNPAGQNDFWVVPNKDKDIGHGKGCQDMPKYAMELYRDHMGIDLLSKRSEEEWNAKKLEFRMEDRQAMQEKYALRTDNQQAWNEITKVLVKGVVKRFQDDLEFQSMPTEMKERAMSPGEEAINQLGLADTLLEQKEEFVEGLK